MTETNKAPVSNFQFLHPSGWPQPKGYANGIAATGRQVFVGGTIGWNAQQEFSSDEIAEQTRQALQNIVAILAEAGAGPKHVVRMTWYVTDKREYITALPDVGRVYREVLGKAFPAMALVQVAGLVEDHAKVEIETTAVVP